MPIEVSAVDPFGKTIYLLSDIFLLKMKHGKFMMMPQPLLKKLLSLLK